VRDHALPVDEELVALRLAAEHRVVVEHETAAALTFLEEHRRGKSAQPSAHDRHVVRLAGVDDARALELPVAHRVRHGHDVVRVAVRPRVVTDAAVAGPVVVGLA